MVSIIDDEGYLHTSSGAKIPSLKIDASTILDRTIAIYGPSKTGKTVITKNLMKILNKQIGQALIIAPSEPSNKSYEGVVDPPLIHYRMYLPKPNASSKTDEDSKGAIRFLKSIWARQEAMASTYNTANRPEILKSLYSKINHNSKQAANTIIQKIRTKEQKTCAQIKINRAMDQCRLENEIGDITTRTEAAVLKIYKKVISDNYDFLWKHQSLTKDERYSLTYIDFSPRLLLIFDDCAAQFRPLFTQDIFRMLFYQNRHCYLTVIFCCQDDTDLPPNLRKNAYISFFTTTVTASSNFERASNSFQKGTKKYVSDIVNDVFVGNRKLAYLRDDDKNQNFYHIEFQLPGKFYFGSDSVRQLCTEVKNNGMSISKENPFYKCFEI